MSQSKEMRAFMKKVNPCAAKIWKKFLVADKNLWLALYERFLVKENYPPYLSRVVAGAGPKDKDMIEVIAHNLACEAVWLLNRVK